MVKNELAYGEIASGGLLAKPASSPLGGGASSLLLGLMSSCLTSLLLVRGVSLLSLISHIQGRDVHCGSLHPLRLISWHFDKF